MRKIILIPLIIFMVIFLFIVSLIIYDYLDDKIGNPLFYQCIKTGGKWKTFPNGCVDRCGCEVSGQALTKGCDCGESKCWNGTGCEDVGNVTFPVDRPRQILSLSSEYPIDKENCPSIPYYVNTLLVVEKKSAASNRSVGSNLSKIYVESMIAESVDSEKVNAYQLIWFMSRNTTYLVLNYSPLVNCSDKDNILTGLRNSLQDGDLPFKAYFYYKNMSQSIYMKEVIGWPAASAYKSCLSQKKELYPPEYTVGGDITIIPNDNTTRPEIQLYLDIYSLSIILDGSYPRWMSIRAPSGKEIEYSCILESNGLIKYGYPTYYGKIQDSP
jgi:hypothetical protein